MTSVLETKIRFVLEPIKGLHFNDEGNPFRKKNNKFYKIFTLLKLKILIFTTLIPVFLFMAFEFQPAGFALIPICLWMAVYILKLKFKFHRVAKKIKEHFVFLRPGEVIAKNFQKNLSLFVVLKKSIGMYYIKKITLDELVQSNYLKGNDELDEPSNFEELNIIKVQTLHENYLKVVPVSGFKISIGCEDNINKSA